MCGLTFIFDRDSDPSTLRRRTAHALTRLRYRGPDGDGVLADGPWSIGHRRLAIIDVDASPQPMRDPSGRYCLAYNGEVYNYRQLRSELSHQWQFRTNGDTEVVLAGLGLKGTEFLARMEGMWAIALWDAQQRQLLMVRDRMGQKPLYYRAIAGGIACASELPALKALSPDGWEEDPDSTADYFRYGFQLPGYTAYRNVFEVLPGHTAVWTPRDDLRQRTYWQIPVEPFPRDRGAATKQLRDALIESVEKRLVADVEVGAFLSGGVDSSLICGIARSELSRSLKTFTIGFEEESYDEREYARLAANAFGTEHFEEVLQGYDEGELEKLILKHVGQPFADPSLLPTALVSNVAAKQVKVALSGDGGDELFCGYQRYQARMMMRWYSRLPLSLRKNTARLVRMLPEPMAHHSRSLLKKAHLFVDAAERQAAETPYIAPLLHAPARLRSLAPDLLERGHQPPGIPETTTPDDLQRMMLADAAIYLPQDILLKVDRASMAHSLEVRAPFLDSKVVESAFSFPRTWHRRWGSGKRLLRESFDSHLPGSLWDRRKQGFGVPLHDWFRGALGRRLREWLEENPGPLHSAGVVAMLDEHASRSRDHGNRLWLIYVYLLWRRSQS